MLSENLKLILHTHLEENEILEVGWSSKYLSDDDRDKTRDIYCLEVRIDGLRGEDALDEQAIKTQEKIAGQLSDGSLGNAYLVLVEHQSLPKNRVRLHKGLFSHTGQIKQGEHIEFEVGLDAGWSFFAGMTPVTADNRDACFALTKDFTRAFVLLSCNTTIDAYSRDFLESMLPCLRTKGSISIDYLKLIPKVCSQGLLVLSFASDTRGDYRNIRLFFNREVKSLIQQTVNRAINGVSWQ